jgi:hypothetical protein
MAVSCAGLAHSSTPKTEAMLPNHRWVSTLPEEPVIPTPAAWLYFPVSAVEASALS